MPRIIISLCCTLVLLAASLDGAEPVSFGEDLAPLLVEQCLACHGPEKVEGGFRVDSYSQVMQEGDSGAPGFEPHDPELSEVFRRIASDDPFERMPLEAEPFEAAQIAMFKRWIEEGAKFDGEDPTADLVTIVPPPIYPAAPEKYPFTVPMTAMAFSANGSELIVGGYHELTVWNPADGSLLRRIENIGQRTRALSLSPDGELLAVGCGAPGRQGETRLLRMSDGQLVGSLGSTSDEVLDVAFSPQGDQLAVGAADGLIRVFEVPSGKERLRLTSHSDFVMALAWSADGSKLASGSRDETAKVFNADSGEVLATYSGHGATVMGVAFHPEGQEVFSGGGDNKIHRWQVGDANKVAEMAFGGEVLELATDGEVMYASSTDKTARTFEAKTQKQIHTFPGHHDWATSLAYHAGTKRLAVGGFDGRIKVWNSEDAEEVSTFVAVPGHETSGPAK